MNGKFVTGTLIIWQIFIETCLENLTISVQNTPDFLHF
jgi:hypothetical protein